MYRDENRQSAGTVPILFLRVIQTGSKKFGSSEVLTEDHPRAVHIFSVVLTQQGPKKCQLFHLRASFVKTYHSRVYFLGGRLSS